MQILLVILLIFLIPSVSAVEIAIKEPFISQGIKTTSSIDLLVKAQTVKISDPKTSIILATEALQLSQENDNFEIRAQAHTLLGELSLESKNVVQSMEHFLQAALIYKNIKDTRYDKADKVIDDLIPIAEEYKVTWHIAEILTDNADKQYKKKRYDDAIVQYKHALNYLTSEDKKTVKERGVIYKKMAQSYKRLKKREETAFFYKKALVEFTVIEDKKNMARILNTLAEAERYLGNYVTALDYSTQGLQLHKQIDDPEGRAKAFTGAGIIYRYIGRYEKSLQHIYQAHLYYKEVNDTNGIAKTSNQMGLIYTRLKQFEQARSFYQLTIDLPQKKIKAKTLASALREVAVIDLNAKQYRSAKEMAKKAYAIYKNEKNKKNQALTLRIIGNVYREELNIEQAIVYYRQSLSIATQIGSKIYQIKALTPLAAMLFSSDVEESILLLHKALALAEEIDSTPSMLYVTREFRKAEKIRGNYLASVEYAENEIYLTGLIQNEKNDAELGMIKAKLYSHKKEMEIDSLREKAKVSELELAKKNIEIKMIEKENKISDLELMQKNYANTILGLLLFVCILTLLFIYRQFMVSKRRNKELDLLASRDPLTNCYNRRVLFENLDSYFKKSSDGNDGCIIMVDIDYFKAVNDKHGHSAGDAVLCGVSRLFQDCVRQSDIVARFGGEEFCIVLDNIPQEEAVHIAETIRYKVENSRFEGIAITCSFGVTSTLFFAETTAELINQADVALYESKSLGRNQVMMWNDTLERNY